MSQRSHSPAARTNRLISKGNCAWRRVNRMAHRLGSKNVPAVILAAVDSIPNMTPESIRSLQFPQCASLREMTALAKAQSIQVLNMCIKLDGMIGLHRKETDLTETGDEKSSNSEIKQNLVRVESYNSTRPQNAEAVFG